MFSVESPSRSRRAESSSIPFRIARGCDGCIASRRPKTPETESIRSVKHIENAENKPDKRLSWSDSRYFCLTPVSWMFQSTRQLGCSAGSYRTLCLTIRFEESTQIAKERGFGQMATAAKLNRVECSLSVGDASLSSNAGGLEG